ncbi:hypothetical protein BpHYR1_001596 [Brachionus plicatilis]|uniref:Uncharacterized protein n=1 Tax=Brachionus plicatilis TaxID=10195 RepID=A0A3M7S0V7_BRAPC|nr:hypothetical protein BpHYR1_001596 [Brachionus plicatilis]
MNRVFFLYQAINSGHRNLQKIKAKIKKNYYFKNLTADSNSIHPAIKTCSITHFEEKLSKASLFLNFYITVFISDKESDKINLKFLDRLIKKIFLYLNLIED